MSGVFYSRAMRRERDGYIRAYQRGEHIAASPGGVPAGVDLDVSDYTVDDIQEVDRREHRSYSARESHEYRIGAVREAYESPPRGGRGQR